jgi:hypothetical protein
MTVIDFVMVSCPTPSDSTTTISPLAFVTEWA